MARSTPSPVRCRASRLTHPADNCLRHFMLFKVEVDDEMEVGGWAPQPRGLSPPGFCSPGGRRMGWPAAPPRVL